jgi:hypothetical protein
MTGRRRSSCELCLIPGFQRYQACETACETHQNGCILTSRSPIPVQRANSSQPAAAEGNKQIPIQTNKCTRRLPRSPPVRPILLIAPPLRAPAGPASAPCSPWRDPTPPPPGRSQLWAPASGQWVLPRCRCLS